MNTKWKRQGKRVLPLLLATTLCFSNHFSLVIKAENLTQKKESLEEDLSKLNNDKDALSKELSNATNSLKSITKQIETAQIELGTAKARQTGQYEQMKKRIKYIYESGSNNLFATLLESESIADLINKADFIQYISEYDREMLKKFQQVHQEVLEKEQRLQEQQKSLTSQKKDLADKYAKLTSLITSTSNDLAAYEKQLAEAEEAQKKAQEALEQNKPAPTPPKEEKPVEKPSTPAEKPSEKPETNPEEKPEKPNKPTPPSNVETLALFAGILECEAGSRDYDALLAVATVIMNRVESSHYPDTIKGVIYQSGQFSPTWSGRLDKVLERGPKPLCFQVAKDAMAGARLDAVRSCYSFRSSNSGVEGITIGGNTFF